MKLFRKLYLLTLAVLAFGYAPQGPAAEITLTYPRPENQIDSRALYPIKVLEIALQYSGKRYALKPSESTMLQGRALMQLRDQLNIDIMWTTPSASREEGLIRIPIPFDKGLIGWRLLLVKENRLGEFSHLKLPSDLQKMTAGQGHDWPDTDIFRLNGFKVKGVVTYESLFAELGQGKIDYFPRSVMEIWNEGEEYKSQNIVIEPTIVMHYPNAFYFYVRKGRSTLAEDVEFGIEKMIADGTFEKLFHETFDDTLRRAQFGKRKILELKNPLLPKENSTVISKLWFQPY